LLTFAALATALILPLGRIPSSDCSLAARIPFKRKVAAALRYSKPPPGTAHSDFPRPHKFFGLVQPELALRAG
jgi:hypothetical protein